MKQKSHKLDRYLPKEKNERFKAYVIRREIEGIRYGWPAINASNCSFIKRYAHQTIEAKDDIGCIRIFDIDSFYFVKVA